MVWVCSTPTVERLLVQFQEHIGLVVHLLGGAVLLAYCVRLNAVGPV